MASKSNPGANALAQGQTALGESALAQENRARLERASHQKSSGYFARAWRRFHRNRLSMVSLFIFILIILFAYGAPLISKYVTQQTYDAQNLAATFAKPNTTVSGYDFATGKDVTAKHWLGTDDLGRDVLTRLAYGGRISLTVSFLALAAALTIGLLIGAASGYYGGWVDGVLMRFVDVIISIPYLFVLILISSMINNNKLITNSSFFRNSGWLVVPIVIAALGWTTICRLIRGEFLSYRQRDFVDAARVLGATNGRIIFRHILPNVVPIIIVWATLAIPGLILTEAALSYLGFGVQIPTPSWGNMLTNSQSYFQQAPFLVVLPGMMIYITVMAVNLMGNGLRDALDPRLND